MVSDLMSNEATHQVLKLDKSWCALQGSEGLYGQTSDLDHIERLVQSLGNFFLSHYLNLGKKVWISLKITKYSILSDTKGIQN